MPGGPHVHSRRGAEHHSAHALGPQALERGDHAVGHLGTDSVAVTPIVKDDDANLPVHTRPDGGAREAIRPGSGTAAACLTISVLRAGQYC
jgi:hypothetical protein